MSNFVLNKSSVNNVVVTLSERSRLISPYFLIVFKNKFSTSDVLKSCSLQSSSSNNRYDLLVIEEKTAPDPLVGEVLLIAGEWSYDVYESSVQTLVVSETTERILQKGFIIVKDN
jgi:hypothetical protein